MRTVIMVFTLLFSVTLYGGADGLTGTWRAEEGATLRFVSPNRLVYNGSSYACRITPEVIYVVDPEEGTLPYPYRQNGKRLTIAFPEGYTVTFTRTAEAKRPSTATTTGSGGTQNHLLQGKFCSWSGSSGGGTSYSSNPWAWFDGQGHFRYGTASYYSGGGDLYANEGGGNSGTYEVHGDTIVLHLSDGSTVRASVHFRHGSRITEFRYGSALYAPQLCE